MSLAGLEREVSRLKERVGNGDFKDSLSTRVRLLEDHVAGLKLQLSKQATMRWQLLLTLIASALGLVVNLIR